MKLEDDSDREERIKSMEKSSAKSSIELMFRSENTKIAQDLLRISAALEKKDAFGFREC